MKVTENIYGSWLLWLFLQKNLTGEIYLKTQAFVFILSFFRCSLSKVLLCLSNLQADRPRQLPVPPEDGDEGRARLPGVQTSLVVSSHPWLSVAQAAFPLVLPLSGLAAEGSSGSGVVPEAVASVSPTGQRVSHRSLSQRAEPVVTLQWRCPGSALSQDTVPWSSGTPSFHS